MIIKFSAYTLVRLIRVCLGALYSLKSAVHSTLHQTNDLDLPTVHISVEQHLEKSAPTKIAITATNLKQLQLQT